MTHCEMKWYELATLKKGEKDSSTKNNTTWPKYMEFLMFYYSLIIITAIDQNRKAIK